MKIADFTNSIVEQIREALFLENTKAEAKAKAAGIESAIGFAMPCAIEFDLAVAYDGEGVARVASSHVIRSHGPHKEARADLSRVRFTLQARLFSIERNEKT